MIEAFDKLLRLATAGSGSNVGYQESVAKTLQFRLLSPVCSLDRSKLLRPVDWEVVAGAVQFYGKFSHRSQEVDFQTRRQQASAVNLKADARVVLPDNGFKQPFCLAPPRLSAKPISVKYRINRSY